VPAYGATVAVWTLGEIGLNAVGPAMIADLAPPQLRGRYNGVYGLSYAAALVFGPVLGTLTLSGLGEVWLWGADFVLATAAGLVVLALGPAIERRQRVAVTAAARLRV